jgi:tetratricopeptide (TPR) repeat protein
LAYYGYRSDLDPQTHGSVQECLQQTTREFPNYSTAWGLLSMTYVDELRFRYRLHSSSPISLERASEAAARAVELDPQDVRALQAQMLTLFFRGEVDAALAVGARAFAINPNDTELAGEYGFRLALSGQWRPGCELVSKSVALNPGPVGYFEAALAVCSYISGDYAAAERWAHLADLRANPIYRVILLAILGKLGKSDQAREERKWLEVNVPGFLNNIRKEIALRIRRPEDQERFIEGLREAGVPIPER